MNTYQYIAKDKKGNTVNGLINAPSESEAVQILHKEELIVISVSESKRKSYGFKKKSQKVKLDEIVTFSRQLATLIDSGITLVNALGILVDQVDNKNFRNVITFIRKDIEAGLSFSDALRKHPQVFSDFYINLVSAGETSGQLNEVLDRLAIYLEKQLSLIRKVTSSLMYPAVVVTMALIITVGLLVKVVPSFKGIFEILGGELPLPTRILIGTSDILRKYFLFAVAIIFVLGFLLKKYINTPKGRYKFDLYKLKVPVLGPLFRKLAVAKFSRTFSTLVRSGISILNALTIVGKISGNKVIEEAVDKCSKSVRDGETIATQLSKSRIFPPFVCRMINVGEQTGQLEKMLSKIADFYEEQVDASAQALTSIIEPLVIVFLGTVIGGIVISLFLPIFKISQLIGR
jgi:type IV pilus assembly protein PilC